MTGKRIQIHCGSYRVMGTSKMEETREVRDRYLLAKKQEVFLLFPPPFNGRVRYRKKKR
jgi:hypothetical protein